MEKAFKITILGCAAATPTSVRHTTAQLLQFHNNYFLLDCAEGTQIQLRKYRIPMMRINNIFISHLHGDHYLGLAGLLFSYHLLGRNREINIYSPPGLKDIIDIHFKVSGITPFFPINFVELNKPGQKLYEDKYIVAETLEMEHRIPTYGFLFREKPLLRNLRKDKVEEYALPIEKMAQIKAGSDYVDENGRVVKNAELTYDPPKPRTYAFCSDTAYTEKFLHQIKNADLLYHEATFLKEQSLLAHEKYHSTSVDAAALAQKARVRNLIIGHYSARYDDMDVFLEQARRVFPDSILAEEGKVIEITSEKISSELKI